MASPPESSIRAWRITLRRFQDSAFSGRGAAIAGGRWNSADGPSLVYASDSLPLAAWEVFVSLPRNRKPPKYVSFSIDLPREGIVAVEEECNLPMNWRSLPHKRSTQLIGDRWLAKKRSLALRVPSAVITGAFNYLIDPNHPDFSRVVIGQPTTFTFDPRVSASKDSKDG